MQKSDDYFISKSCSTSRVTCWHTLKLQEIELEVSLWVNIVHSEPGSALDRSTID